MKFLNVAPMPVIAATLSSKAGARTIAMTFNALKTGPPV